MGTDLPDHRSLKPTLSIGSMTFVGFDYLDFLAYALLLQHLPRDSVFVEAGAIDGLYGSNTWSLERHRGWSGLLVEPNLCGKCHLPVNRPGARTHFGAICPRPMVVAASPRFTEVCQLASGDPTASACERL
jgi:hypothetical protein